MSYDGIRIVMYFVIILYSFKLVDYIYFSFKVLYIKFYGLALMKINQIGETKKRHHNDNQNII